MQIKAIATQATADLQAKLGSEGADAYAQRSNWLRMLKNGNAFSTDPKNAPAGAGNTSVYVVPATRRPGGG